MLADISTAQELFGMNGRLSRIDLIATPQEAQAIAATLPPGLRVVSVGIGVASSILPMRNPERASARIDGRRVLAMSHRDRLRFAGDRD